MVAALLALLLAAQGGPLAETGVYDCLLGAVPDGLGYDDLPPRLDRRFAVTIHGLRALEEDGEENLGLRPGVDYVLTDPTGILGAGDDVVVNLGATNQLVVHSGPPGGGRTILAVAEQPFETIWYLVRSGPADDAEGPELRGLCRLGREWRQPQEPS